MVRKPCCEKVGLKRGPWTADEDGKLVSFIATNGICCWRAIPKLAGLLRCGKSCRLRWTNYLRPDLKRGIFSEAEENLILDLHATVGNRWSRIAAQLPGRTDNEIKNYWNTCLKKRLRSQGLDPATHLPLGALSKQSDDGEDGESSDDVDASSTNIATRNSLAEKKVREPRGQPKVPRRQPKGPKPQLKMRQSKEGPQLVLLTASASTKSDADSDQSCGSTVTAEGQHHGHEIIVRKLTTAPSFPQAELWKYVKPVATTSNNCNPFGGAASDSVIMNEWSDSDYIIGMQVGMQAPANVENCVGESHNNYCSGEVGLFQPGACSHFAQQPEMGLDSWTVDHTEMRIPDLLFEPVSVPLHPEAPQQLHPYHQSQELQRLATLLDLI